MLREALAVTGYVPNNVAKTLSAGGVGAVDVSPEIGVSEVAARVQRDDIEEARLGASQKGETLVQLILKKNATVETIVRTSANAKGLERFYDPNLDRLRQQATAKVILI